MDTRDQRRRKYIERLHKDYKSGNLALLIGAGVSVPSGFPSWDQLNQRLLLNYVKAEHGDDLLSASLLPALARQLYELFGRDAAAEFVRISAKSEFDAMLIEALYDDRTIEELPVSSLQYQIATMAKHCRVCTLNLEPLLELSLSRLRARQGEDVDWRSFRMKNPDRSSASPVTASIQHLHGWIDPDGTRSSQIVLTEKHYFDLTEDESAEANATLKDLLTQDGSVLTVGLSWADYNLRRMLYHLQKSDKGTKIFSILREDDLVLEEYTTRRWEGLNLVPIFVREFDAISPLMRDIVWGMAEMNSPPNWLATSLNWRESQLPDKTVFSEDWQKVAYEALSVLVNQVRTLFGVKPEELINSAFFIPMRLSPDSEVRLHQIGSSRLCRSAEKAQKHAGARSLRLGRGMEQGAAGVAFAVGNNRQVLHGEPGLDVGFDQNMKDEWSSAGEHYRDWRSVLCVPLLDSPDWLPIGVVTLTSNMVQPFWTHLASAKGGLQAELYAMMRKTASWLLTAT
jgi:hypothetical protein